MAGTGAFAGTDSRWAGRSKEEALKCQFHHRRDCQKQGSDGHEGFAAAVAANKWKRRLVRTADGSLQATWVASGHSTTRSEAEDWEGESAAAVVRNTVRGGTAVVAVRSGSSPYASGGRSCRRRGQELGRPLPPSREKKERTWTVGTELDQSRLFDEREGGIRPPRSCRPAGSWAGAEDFAPAGVEAVAGVAVAAQEGLKRRTWPKAFFRASST